jgi:hypothetical protein
MMNNPGFAATAYVSTRSVEPSSGCLTSSIPEPRVTSPGTRPFSDLGSRQVGWRGVKGGAAQIEHQKVGSLTDAGFCRRLGVNTVTYHAGRHRFREAPAARGFLRRSTL